MDLSAPGPRRRRSDPHPTKVAESICAKCYLLAVPRDVCIFCERAEPLVKITKEHLFSRWVDEVLTPDLLGEDRSFERTTTSNDGITVTKAWSAEVIAAIEAAVVCGSSQDGCNGGWMSGLDGGARHCLSP